MILSRVFQSLCLLQLCLSIIDSVIARILPLPLSFGDPFRFGHPHKFRADDAKDLP